MGDDEHRALVVADELLDDPPALDVEVGLGLVEQQDVGGEHEAAASATSLRWPPLRRAVGRSRSWSRHAEIAQVADRVALEARRAERLALLEQPRMVLEDAGHAAEVGGERGVGELGLDARRGRPRARRRRAARRGSSGGRCARRR